MATHPSVFSSLPKRAKVEKATKQDEQALRVAIASGAVAEVEQLIDIGAKLPGSSRQHPIFPWLAKLKPTDDARALRMMKALIGGGFDPDFRVGLSHDEAKSLPKPAQVAFMASIVRKKAWNINNGVDLGSSLLERLSFKKLPKAAAFIAAHVEPSKFFRKASHNQSTITLQGLIENEDWATANLLLERYQQQIAGNRPELDFWNRLTGSMMGYATTKDAQGIEFLSRLAAWINEYSTLSKEDGLSSSELSLKLGTHRVRAAKEHLDPRALDRYLEWFPQDWDTLVAEKGPADRGLWTVLLSRAIVCGPEDAIWRRAMSDPQILASLNTPIGQIKLKHSANRGHAVSAHLPATPLDVLVCKVGPTQYWPNLSDEEEAEEDTKVQEAAVSARHKSWSRAIEELRSAGALAGFERKKEGFHWTYAEIFSKPNIFDLKSRSTRPLASWWHSVPHWQQANALTGSTPHHHLRSASSEDFEYWTESGFDPGARDKHGHCGFAKNLERILLKPKAALADHMRSLGNYLALNPSLWSETTRHGNSLVDLSAAHPVFFKNMKKAGHTPSPMALGISAFYAQHGIFKELKADYKMPASGTFQGGWTLHGLTAWRVEVSDKSDQVLRRGLSLMLDELKRPDQLDAPGAEGAYLHRLAKRWTRHDVGTPTQAARTQPWGETWTRHEVNRLIPFLGSAMKIFEQPPKVLCEQAMSLLLDPSEWPGRAFLNPKKSVSGFMELFGQLLPLVKQDADLLDRWHSTRDLLSEIPGKIEELDEAMDEDTAARMLRMVLDVGTASLSSRSQRLPTRL